MTEGNRPRSICEVFAGRTLRLLVIAPHPDDFDAIAITLRFLARRGDSLQVIVARSGSGVEDSYGPGLTLAAKTQLREREQRQSAHFFGLSDDHLTFISLISDADDQPVQVPENLGRLEVLVRQHAPDVVFLPHGNDTNSGHRVMYALVRQAARRLGAPPVLLLIRDPKTLSMRTDCYCAYGEEDAAWKAEMLRFHDTQQQRNLNTRGHGFDERILAHNRRTASELSLDAPYAESFEIERLQPEPERPV